MKSLRKHVKSIICSDEKSTVSRFLILQLIVLLLFSYLFLLLQMTIVDALNIGEEELKDIMPNPIYGSFFKSELLMLISVILETLFFQYIPFLINRAVLREKPDTKPFVFIVISSLLFGFAHTFQTKLTFIPIVVVNVFNKILMGIILYSTMYVLYKKNCNPYWPVILLHFVFNSIVILTMFIFL